MRSIDWLLMTVPMLIILGVALHTRRYVRGVADFMAGGRAAGRYLLCTARSEQGAGAVMFVGLFEVFARTGFTTNWWQQITVPVGLVISITGFVYYRYRQTRAMTLAQFLEMRYSRRFRIFTGALGFLAGVCNFGIIPCIGARFFVNFLELPQTVHLLSAEVPTFLLLMACFLTISTLLTLSGGQVTILAINCLEGMFSQVCQVIVAIALLATFRWVTMHHVLLAQPPGHSLVNPFDSFSTKDFNLWWVLMGLFLNSVYGAMAWQNNHAFNASGATPHDARMGNVLTTWKNFGLLLMITLMGACVVTYLQHPDYASGAAAVQASVGRIADPLGGAQMRMPIALAHLLPVGVKGLVCAMILMGVISGDGIHLHSWSSIFVQDVVLPLRARPLTVEGHLRLLRAGIVGVAVFAFCFGALFKQTEYVLMWFQVTTAIFVGGAGSAIIGGLYWKRGTTAGAWVGLLTGSTLCITGILVRQWNPDFPLNGTQISFYAALISIAAYVLVSAATGRVPHNMDRLLHRGKYAVEPEGGEDAAAAPARRFSLRQLIGIDEHFTRGDLWVAYGVFWWSMLWFFVFVVGSTMYLLHPFSNEAWAQYWRVTAIWLPLVVTIITTIWFTIGCTRDLRRFFQRLREERIDIHDDGTVDDPASSAPAANDPAAQPLSPGQNMNWHEKTAPLRHAASALLIALVFIPRADGQAVGQGTNFDLQGFIDKELAAGKKDILVPPGRYRVKPRNARHLVLNKLDGVNIIADGVEMICTETTNALEITDCANLSIRGLVIDYDPLPYTEGRITALSPDKKIHDVELFDGYPDGDLVTGERYEVYAPATRTLCCPTYSGTLEKHDARHFRFTKREEAGGPEQVGDLCVMGANWTPAGSAPHAVFSNRCKNLRLDHMTVYASNCFGYLEHDGDGNTYDHCKLDRRPPETDPVRRGSPRLRSTNADAFHSKFAVRGPNLLECTAKFQADDCVNICGAYHMVTACHGSELRVLANGGFFGAGESVELLTYAGARLPDARAVSIEPDGTINEEEKTFLSKQQMNDEIRARPNVKAYKVTLDRAVDLPMGSLIASTARVGNGFVVRGCDFGFNRSRGILIKASNGRVVDNTIVGSWMEAIKVSPEYWWLEAGSSNHVEISGNTIRDCRSVGIAVYANGGAGQVAPSGAHHQISIVGNAISGTPLPNIAVTSTEGLRIERNTSSAPSKGTEQSAWLTHFMGFDKTPVRVVMWKNCSQVAETQNESK